MQAQTPRRRRGRLAAGLVFVGLATGTFFGGRAMGALDGGPRSGDDFSVHVTRIENPETRFFRTNISTGDTVEGAADLYFYKVRDNKNGRILYFMYYQGAMLAPLYTTGD